MIWLIITGFIVAIAWMAYRAKRSRRSSAALESERGGQAYKPDPLRHLDIKANDVSIVGPSVEAKPMVGAERPRDSDYQFEIEYVDRNEQATKRRIAWVSHEPDGEDTILHAYCELAQADRTFRSSRIQTCKNLWTGRGIKDLGRYFRNGSYLR